MGVERQKEKQKAPGELAAEATNKEQSDEGAKDKPRRTRKRAAKSEAKPSAEKRTPTKAESQPDTAPEEEPAREPAKPAAKTRARGRARRPGTRTAPSRREQPEAVRPRVRAQAKYVRSSARKARLVIDHIRGKSVGEARAILSHAPRTVARDIEKLLASAVANAENNHELVGDDLYVQEVYANEGPTLKRFKPRAYGRATRIRKRTTHLTLTLTPKE